MPVQQKVDSSVLDAEIEEQSSCYQQTGRVHPQSFDRGAADRRCSLDQKWVGLGPAKMFTPNMLPRIEKRNMFETDRVDPMLLF